MLVGSERATVIVGHFGSGKSEVAVNLALHVRNQRGDVALVDLDLVNPYFRSREATEYMEKMGISVVIPDRQHRDADLPILVPGVRALLMAGTAYGVLDVGGDDVGARVLGALKDGLGTEGLRMLMVLNARRPFSDTVDGCLKVQREIEAAARHQVDGYISNTHLMEDTSVDTVLEGLELTRAVAGETGLDLAFATAPETLAEQVRGSEDVPILAMKRHLLPPWLKELNEQEEDNRQIKPLFA